MSADRFVHLRLHTAYSLLEGAVRIKDLAKLCVAEAMPAVAITDTNNLFGGLEFSATLSGAGVQPIIGCQLSVARDDGEDRGSVARGRNDPGTDPVVVLAQNLNGYQGLLRLLYAAHNKPDDHLGPYVGFDELVANAGGLLLLTGGPRGPVGRPLLAGRIDVAERNLRRLRDAFADRLYVEILRHGMDDETRIEPLLIDLADRLALPLVATNDVYFAKPEMHEAHDALLCVAGGAHIADAKRRRVTSEHYFKTAQAMRELFADLPDAADNTVLIARRCSFMVETARPMLPAFEIGEGIDEARALRDLARQGLEQRLAAHVVIPGMLVEPQQAEQQQAHRRSYEERLDYELDVICTMGFAGYFLIVAEFIRWSKQQGIPVGPGRGSGAGSVVAWSLTITDLDPIRFGLLFERFLNPERISMPDFDIDFCQDRRDEVIQHVVDRYGAERVAQIITFGKLQARAVLRDVGRVLGMAYGYVDKICKLVPNNPANPVTLDQALAGEPQLQAMIAEDETVARLVDIARRLEGLYRHASTHAAGVVIADRPLVDLIPLYRDPRSNLLVTGFNMKWVEPAGLVKFDFLGLKTLTVLARAIELIEQGRGITLDLSALPLDDRSTYEMLGRGETVGVFQLESAGMRDVLRKLKPDKLEDIIAVVALYRPGPMDNIPSYIRRKHGDEAPDYLYPTLEPILRETYGIMIYQEQVMQIAQELSGYSLGSADLLRRAMGKKIKEEMDQQREAFVSGAKGRGVPAAKAAQIFDLVAKFAGYGFNKSHAAAYALIAYQTAYLKANYPIEFFAASMTYDLNNTDKLNMFRQELDRVGIRLLPPDINRSPAAFGVEYGGAYGVAGGAVRFALAAIKNVGEAAMAGLVAERNERGPFLTVSDLAYRLDNRQINKRQLENLVRAGALEPIDNNRRRLYEGVERILKHAGSAAAERESGQMGLFAVAGSGTGETVELPAVEDWGPMERLKAELEALGFYLSAHPLDAYGNRLRRLGVTRSADVLVQSKGKGGTITLAGTVIAKRERTSGKGTRYAFVQLSDASGVFEVTVFSEILSATRDLLEVGRSLLLKVTIQAEGETARLTAQSIEPIEDAAKRLVGRLEVFIDSVEPLAAIDSYLKEHGNGRDQVRLVSWLGGGAEVAITLPTHCSATPMTIAGLKRIPGVRDVVEV